MKGLHLRLLCLLWLSGCAATALAQVTHTVQRKETAYGIARHYGVDLNALLDLNPWAEGGIRKGDVLRIPGMGAPNRDTEVQAEVEVEPEIFTEPDTVPTQRPGDADVGVHARGVLSGRPVPPTWSRDTLRIAVFLPFFSGRDSLGRQELRLRQIAMECAAGVRLALDSGAVQGAHFDVRFLDTGVDTSGTMLCGPDHLLQWGGPVDIAVGPLKRSVFREVRRWKGMEGAAHLSLTDLGVSLAHGERGVVVPHVPLGRRMEALAEHVASLHRGERILLLATGDIRNIEAEDAFRAAWVRLMGRDSLLSWSEIEVSSSGLGVLRDSLSDVRRNVLVVPGGAANRSLAGVLQTEIQLGDTMEFRLYADDDWRSFGFLDPELRERVGMTVVDGGGSFPDSSAFGGLDSTHFCLARRMAELNGGASGAYGWLAHDVLREAMVWTAGHGPSWPERLAEGAWLVRPLPSPTNGWYSFHWTPVEQADGSVTNGAVRILRQEGYQWVDLGRSVPHAQTNRERGR